MTATNGPLLDDDGMIDALRAAGRGGRETTRGDAAAAIEAGRRIKRRRQSFQVLGSGAAIAGVAAFAVLVAGNGPRPDTVVAPPAGQVSTPGEGTEKAPAASGRTPNTQLILDVLGAGFVAGDSGDRGQVVLDPDSAAAEGLPTGYQAAVRLGIFGSADGLTLAQQCGSRVEKGSHLSACEPLTLTGGRVVQVQESRTVLGEYVPAPPRTAPGASDSTFVSFDRGDSSFVRLDFYVFDSRDASSPTRQAAAVAWLEPYTAKLAQIAADPEVQPKPGAATQPADVAPGVSTYAQNQAYLREALGSSFGQDSDGYVYLEPGSAKDAELPGRTYQVSGEVSFLTERQFQAACFGAGEVFPCSRSTLPDGRELYERTWADRDAEVDEMRGQQAVYIVDGDAPIVSARLTANGTGFGAAERDAQVDGLTAWLFEFRDALIAGATDERLIVEVPETVLEGG